MKYIDAEKLQSVLQNTINSMKEKDATTLRREAIGKAMEVYPPSINEDADGMPYDEHTDLQQGFITGYELGFNARKEK
jgi:uncharacterized protein with HEPN domain